MTEQPEVDDTQRQDCDMPPWLTPQEVADQLGVRVQVVYDRIRYEGLPAWNAGTDRRPMYRIDQEKLNAWAESRQVQGEPRRRRRRPKK